MLARKSFYGIILLAIVMVGVTVSGCGRKSDKVVPVAPQKVQNPQPAHGAVDVPVTTDLSWDAAGGATSYDVYFGTDSVAVANADNTSPEFKGNQAGLNYDPPGNLAYDTTYYWRIDSVNTAGTTKGNVWSFTTESAPAVPPDKVTGPVPADGATGVPVDQVLSWDAAGGATSYDVYFGTDSVAVAAADNTSPEFKGNQADLSYDPPGDLAYDTTYYWRIDSVNAFGTTTGDVWSFTTVTPAALVIVTRRLPYAESGVFYSQTLEAVGGVVPYNWQVDSGSLPDDLNLNAAGVISGTPAGSSSSFTVRVTDAAASSVTQLLAISVDLANTEYVSVEKGAGGDHVTIADALAALPNPLTANYVIEILDNATYKENLSINMDTASYHLTLRSAYNCLATIEAADANVDVIYVNAPRVSIERLRICGASGSDKAGVKVDEWSTLVANCVIFNNNVAIDAGSTPGVTFASNTCYGPKGISTSGGGSAQVRNNIVYATGDWCMCSTICSADYNLYYAPSGSVGFDGGTNYYPTLPDWQAYIFEETHSRYGNPNFLNLAGFDFHLTGGSTEAIDHGSNSGWTKVVLDAEGYARPHQDDLLDIGAFEHR